MSKEYDDYLVQQNIDRFSRLLESEQEPKKRATLSQLLEEERAKMVGSSMYRSNGIRGGRAGPELAGADESIMIRSGGKTP